MNINLQTEIEIARISETDLRQVLGRGISPKRETINFLAELGAAVELDSREAGFELIMESVTTERATERATEESEKAMRRAVEESERVAEELERVVEELEESERAGERAAEELERAQSEIDGLRVDNRSLCYQIEDLERALGLKMNLELDK